MKLLWTKRGLKRLQSAFDYIADNFYLDYAIQFDSDARNVALMLPANPQLGREAFPELDRPEIRKISSISVSWMTSSASSDGKRSRMNAAIIGR